MADIRGENDSDYGETAYYELSSDVPLMSRWNVS